MVRGLYSDPIEVRSQLKQFMTTNELPEIKSTDGGTWRRIRVIEFLSKFEDNPDPNNKYEFKLDDKLKDTINMWAGAFVSYLIHIYTTMYDVENKIPEPIEVMIATNTYRQEQDVIREYYDSCIDQTSDKTDIIRKRDLSANFKLWFKGDREGSAIPKTKNLYEYMEKTLKFKYSPAGYVGMKFKRDMMITGNDTLDSTDLDA
jgi:phage/plasmid-associated DNA primase